MDKKIGNITKDDIVYIELDEEIFSLCVKHTEVLSKSIIDREDLHDRDYLERFINILMGEVAEQAVVKWLNDSNKYVKQIIDKESNNPDPGHDIEIKDKKERIKKCSIKSSLSYKMNPDQILKIMTIASKESEVRDVNIQVYFWYTLNPPKGENRITVPSIKQMALMCWFAKKDLLGSDFESYNHENRSSPSHKLIEGRKMKDLLNYLM